MGNNSQKENLVEEPPPFWGSWNVWYAVVLATLVLLIAGFYLFTKTYS
jgi:hypothetical protein